jgi:aspartate oxidase
VTIDAEVLIVGSGAAGLTAALNLAETHKVAVIAKGALGDSASARAQGGIAAVLEEGDSFEAHVNDTMIAGAGLNDRAVVEHRHRGFDLFRPAKTAANGAHVGENDGRISTDYR